MKPKIYSGKTYQEALDKAKTELGEDVIILDSKETKSGGFFSEEKNIIEVRVIAGNEEFSLPQKNKANLKINSNINFSHKRKKTYQGLNNKLNSPEISYIGNEIEKLNGYIKKILFPELPKTYNKIRESLERTGINSIDAVEFLMNTYSRLENIPNISSEVIIESLEAQICRLFNSRKLFSDNNEQQVFSLIGPAGTGKTTSLMKMATNREITQDKKVAIISTDCYRMAATEALKKFSNLTSIPVIEVRDTEKFSDSIDNLRKFDIILVDTPGRSPFNKKYISEMENYFLQVENMKKLLVLSSTTDSAIVREFSQIYSSLGVNGMIITKIDEIHFPGKVVSMVKAANLPVYYYGIGQSIPNDIKINNDRYIWEKIESNLNR